MDKFYQKNKEDSYTNYCKNVNTMKDQKYLEPAGNSKFGTIKSSSSKEEKAGICWCCKLQYSSKVSRCVACGIKQYNTK